MVYRTTQGKIYPIEIGFALVPVQHVSVDSLATTEACKNGCGLYGRNGGCPPFSPRFHEISGEEMIILYAKLLTEHFPTKVIEGPYYSRWVFVETFMTPLMNRIGKALTSSQGGYFLSSGNCHSCRPKRCAVKDALNCRKPLARTYSLESTGVLVTQLMKDTLGLELQWWRRNEPHYIPAYMVKVVGLKGDGFSKRGFGPNVIRDALSSEIRMRVQGYNSCSSGSSEPFT